MLPIITLPAADSDSDSFFLYIAQDNLKIANRFFSRIEETTALISEFPLLAPAYETSNPFLAGVRWFPIKDFPKYLIFYISTDENVTILRILHKSQNIAKILNHYSP